MKSKVDRLDVDTLVPVLVALTKPSDAGKHDVVYKSVKFEESCLTLFRMGVGKGGGTKNPPPPTSSSPVTSTNVGISLKNFLTFSFNSFCQTGVQFQVCT